MPIDPSIQMWVTFAVIVVALGFYASERVPMEITSLGVIGALLVFFHFFPVLDISGIDRIGPVRILAGFANPALITVLALLVVGQALVSTGALDVVASGVFRIGGGHATLAIGLALIFVLVISAFLNNIPVVVIFIPIMQALAARLARSSSSVMIPLSYAAILGGMTTLIGSSTNLLVSSALIEAGEQGFEFFDFTALGSIMAAAGLVYVLTVPPILLRHREAMASQLVGDTKAGRQFLAQVEVAAGSVLVGKRSVGGLFRELPDLTVLMIQRGEHAFLPPFEDIALSPGDVAVIAATREALTSVLTSEEDALHPTLRDGREEEDSEQRWREGEQSIAEVMVTPSSRLIGRDLEQIGFRYQTHCIVLGIQRRSRMIRARVTEIRLEAGDVLLVQGGPEDIAALRSNPDVLLMTWSAAALPQRARARRAGLIFLAVVVCAASGLLPIVVAAVVGALGMLVVGVINIRQASRAMDRTIVMMIPAALALGTALQETGGATFLTGLVIDNLSHAGPVAVLSGFFLLVAVLSNILSTKATAVLFTPIAIGIAHGLDLPVEPFAVAVVFAANCSFASPIGYQTNLLVMGPGHYRFIDFVYAGAPLIVLMWLVFSIAAPLYYGWW